MGRKLPIVESKWGKIERKLPSGAGREEAGGGKGEGRKHQVEWEGS